MTKTAADKVPAPLPSTCPHVALARNEADTAYVCEDCAEVMAAPILAVPFPPLPADHDERILFRLDQRLENGQRIALRALLNGLAQDGARLADGRLVELPQHAIGWLLENLNFTGGK